MPVDPKIIASRHLFALSGGGTHYRVDRDAVNRALRGRRRRDIDAEAAHYGFVTHKVLEYVPLSKIVPEPVWRPERIERVREAIRDNRPLPPIEADLESDGRYHISDGIHRYNASVEAGFTHIPVIRTVTVETPDRYLPPEEEHPKLPVGTFVRLRRPPPGTAPWAVVVGYLGQGSDRGHPRHRYELDGIERGRRDYIGDYADDRFDLAEPPESVRRILFGR